MILKLINRWACTMTPLGHRWYAAGSLRGVEYYRCADCGKTRLP